MPRRLEVEALDELIHALAEDGRRVLGPKVRDGAIVLDDLGAAADLPRGWVTEAEPGRFRVRRDATRAFFAFTVGHDSWKRFLLPPRQRLWRATRAHGTLAVEADATDPGRLAFLGVRACDARAIAIQAAVRRVHGQPPAAAEPPFVVGVGCARASATCFCASMGAGPAFDAETPADLVLTELDPEGDHHFLAEARSPRGFSVLERLPTSRAADADVDRAAAQAAATRAAQRRRVTLSDPGRFFADRRESPRWREVERRCLSCANCTLVCPTCFCTTVTDATDLSGEIAERWLQWDSCFNLGFSELHGGSVRESTASRYRQWLSHKLGTWHEQFGSSGCVGCGRCIAWCPVGIDLTEEVAALREDLP